MRTVPIVLIAAFVVACLACGSDHSEDVGKIACNKINGAFRGRILGVQLDPVNNSGILVYSVQRPNGRVTYAPVDNTIVVSDVCPAGNS